MSNCPASAFSFRGPAFSELWRVGEEALGSFFSEAAVPRQRSKPSLAAGRYNTQSSTKQTIAERGGGGVYVDSRIIVGPEFVQSAFCSKDRMTPNCCSRQLPSTDRRKTVDILTNALHTRVKPGLMVNLGIPRARARSPLSPWNFGLKAFTAHPGSDAQGSWCSSRATWLHSWAPS